MRPVLTKLATSRQGTKGDMALTCRQKQKKEFPKEIIGFEPQMR